MNFMAVVTIQAFMVAPMVKNPPAMWEAWAQSLGQENPWERLQPPAPVLLPGESHGQRGLQSIDLYSLTRLKRLSTAQHSHHSQGFWSRRKKSGKTGRGDGSFTLLLWLVVNLQGNRPCSVIQPLFTLNN